jgi:hypothetical protein
MRALVGIEPYEVRQVLEAKKRWPRPGTGTAGVPVLTIWGRTGSGRPLIVALHHAGGLTWRIIGARDMTDKEQAEFAGWEETR